MNIRSTLGLVALGFAGTGQAAPLAFPEAMGFGNQATGGRGGKVVHVTNLNDAGAGSFRDAVSASNRIVVFDVGGWITLKTAVSAKSNLTIAGQTAPGQGIGFRGGEISFAKQSNVIMRHVRIVPGDETASSTDDALSLYLAHNVILDHCSFEFAPWNNIDGVSDDWQNYPVTDITFQRSLIANPTGQQFGAHCESVNSNWAWYYNAFVSSHNRNPLAKVNDVFVNNILYNYEAGYTTHTSTNFSHDVIGNYFIYGPASAGNTWFQLDKNQTMYYSGNLLDTDRDGALNGTTTNPYWYQGEGTVLTSPWSTVTTSNPVYSAASAFRIVTSQAGTLPHSELDALIWSQVNTLGKGTAGGGTGPGPSSLYTTQTTTGLSNRGYGTITGGTKPTDTDNDGMPDFWEAATGSNLNGDDAMNLGADGYALIEKYLNWLGTSHGRVPMNSSATVDLQAFTSGFSAVSPTYTVSGAKNGSVTVSGHTATFTPTANYTGEASFSYTVKGSDGTTFTETVAMLVEPSSITVNPITCVYAIDSAVTDKSWSNAANWTPKAVPGALDTAIVRTGEAQVSADIGGLVKVEPAGILRLMGSYSVKDLRLQGGTLKSTTSNPLYGIAAPISVESPSTILVGSAAASVFQVTGALKGTGAITKTGVGVLLLSTTSPSLSGNWSVAQGAVRLRAARALGTGAVSVATGASIDDSAAGGLSGIASLALGTDGTNHATVTLGAKDTVKILILGKDTVVAGLYSAANQPGWLAGSGSLLVLQGKSSTGLAATARTRPGWGLSVSSRVLGASTTVRYVLAEPGADLVVKDLSGREAARLALSGTEGTASLGSLGSLRTGGWILSIERRSSAMATTLVFETN